MKKAAELADEVLAPVMTVERMYRPWGGHASGLQHGP